MTNFKNIIRARRDIFEHYSLDGFRDAFASAFEVVRETPITDSLRTLFLLRRR